VEAFPLQVEALHFQVAEQNLKRAGCFENIF